MDPITADMSLNNLYKKHLETNLLLYKYVRKWKFMTFHVQRKWEQTSQDTFTVLYVTRLSICPLLIKTYKNHNLNILIRFSSYFH